MGNAMRHSRTNPSNRYEKMLAQYRQLHRDGDRRTHESPDLVFPGKSLPPQAHHICRLIGQYRARTVLDYGAGKGTQYMPLPFTDDKGLSYPSIKDYWGGVEVRCYDPGYEPFSELPSGRFDGVIATDVLEHCPEEDMEWILAEMFQYADKFVFANVACFPAFRILPNGANAHCTIRPPKWWRKLVDLVAARFPAVRYEIRLQADRQDGGKVLAG
jgi:hypothetical protein